MSSSSCRPKADKGIFTFARVCPESKSVLDISVPMVVDISFFFTFLVETSNSLSYKDMKHSVHATDIVYVQNEYLVHKYISVVANEGD